jgi:hypothetical protein
MKVDPDKTPRNWDETFIRLAGLVGMVIFITLGTLIANYIAEFWGTAVWFPTHLYWSAIFIELGVLVACVLGGAVADATNL